jgi:hypothetical protein
MSNHVKDPYSVLLKRNKLPMSLLETEGKGSEGKVRLYLSVNFACGVSCTVGRVGLIPG